VTTSPAKGYADQPVSSPWLAQLPDFGPARRLAADVTTDVAIVGAGIAGVATAFFVLRETAHDVVLVERDRVARGATGRNAGQMTTYFERPLCAIAEEFGVERAVAGQRDFDTAHDLFDLVVAEVAASGRFERFDGHMGMFNLHQLDSHLRNNLVRRQGGWRTERCLVSETAEFLGRLAPEFAGLYEVVPQARISELLEIDDDTYCAVVSDLKGCANSGLLAQQTLGHLLRRHPDRFRFFDHTDVARVTVAEDRAVLSAAGREISARSVVLCTNGFVDHAVCDAAGGAIRIADDQRITGRVAHMTAFVEHAPRRPAAMSYIRNAVIGGDTAYVYVTAWAVPSIRFMDGSTARTRRSPGRCSPRWTTRCARSPSPTAPRAGPTTSTGTASWATTTAASGSSAPTQLTRGSSTTSAATASASCPRSSAGTG
jgi:hypothetical protein